MRYRNKHTQAICTVIFDGTAVRMSTFSEHGSIHYIVWNGVPMDVTLQFLDGKPDESGRPSRYGGYVTLYQEENGTYWFSPCYEFHQLYEAVDG